MKHVGTVKLSSDGKQWIVGGPPHFVIRLKRLFEGASKATLGQIEISSTDANARDLVWLMSRYPLRTTGETLRMLDAAARRHDDRLVRLEQILSPDYRPPKFGLAVPPRLYQTQAAAVYLNQGYLLLADDLGLGKTCSAICTFTDHRTLPAVVVCQSHLQRQWQQQVTLFAPELFTHIIATTQPYDLPERAGRQPDVLIITYSKLAAWAEVIGNYAKSIVFDEAQELRRSGSGKYTAARMIAEAVDFRLSLTATPIYNYGGEIFSVLDVTAPGLLGTWNEFYREWCTGNYDQASIKDPKAFGAYLREQGIMLRRTREEVGRELPSVVRVLHDIDCDTKALDAVTDKASELARIILSRTGAARGEKMHAAEELSNLVRQATGLAKAPYVAEFVKLLASSGEPIVLCGWHRAVYEIWRDRLQGLRVGMYTGHESPAQKDAIRNCMVKGELDVLILSLRSGSGLDGLQSVCRTIVFGELDWAPGVHDQCVGRLHRDGQANSVNAYYLISEGGSDPIMCRVLGLKRDQAEGIRNPNMHVIEELSRDGGHIKELAEQMLSHGAKPVSAAGKER